MTSEALTPPAFLSGERLLRIVATAMTRLAQRRLPATPVYDDVVQGAYNQVVLACLRSDVTPPASVPDMAGWAADLPIGQWPLGLSPDLEAADGFLVDRESGTPTQQCLEWAVIAPDPTAELFENVLVHDVLASCRNSGFPVTYTAFRRLLTNQPVLTEVEFQRHSSSLDLILLQTQLEQAYRPISSAYLRDYRAAACGRCGCLLVPIDADGYRCELDRCRRQSTVVGASWDIRHAGGLRQLSRPLRMFITGPGIAEIELEAALARLGLEAEMWPNFDAYDLRITFPNGRVWAVDVKDRANPILLGRGTGLLRPDPPYHRGFLVVPAYRFADRDGYRRIFKQHATPEVRDKLQLMSDHEFLQAVRDELRHTDESVWGGRDA